MYKDGESENNKSNSASSTQDKGGPTDGLSQCRSSSKNRVRTQAR